MELASLHNFGSKNMAMAPNFLELLCPLVLRPYLGYGNHSFYNAE